MVLGFCSICYTSSKQVSLVEPRCVRKGPNGNLLTDPSLEAFRRLIIRTLKPLPRAVTICSWVLESPLCDFFFFFVRTVLYSLFLPILYRREVVVVTLLDLEVVVLSYLSLPSTVVQDEPLQPIEWQRCYRYPATTSYARTQVWYSGRSFGCSS